MRLRKKEYYAKEIEMNKNNIKGVWNLMNSIIKNTTIKHSYPNSFTDGNECINIINDIVGRFNEYFVSVGLNLAKQLGDSPLKDQKIIEKNIERNPNSLFLSTVETKEIYDIVNAFKNKRSTDSNGIDMIIVKKVINSIALPLTYICNLSFTTGSFLQGMKTAKVIPLYKAGDQKLFSNYRPVSLLCQFSKILEKIFVKRVGKFLDDFNLLTNC